MEKGSWGVMAMGLAMHAACLGREGTQRKGWLRETGERGKEKTATPAVLWCL